MELQFFNRENSSGHKNGKPQVTFHATGNIRINGAAVEKMKLDTGRGIDLAYDKTQKQWYLRTNGAIESAFVLRAAGSKEKTLQFNASAIVKEVFAVFEAQKSGASVAALVGGKIEEGGSVLYPLLMKAKPVRT